MTSCLVFARFTPIGRLEVYPEEVLIASSEEAEWQSVRSDTASCFQVSYYHVLHSRCRDAYAEETEAS